MSLSGSHKSPTLRRSSSVPCGGGGEFNDSATADVILRLHLDDHRSPFDSFGTSSESVPVPDDESDVQIHLHSHFLRRSKYFATLLSDRWQQHNDDDSPQIHRLNLGVPPTPDSIKDYLSVLQLLYTDDFSTSINSVVTALALLPIALELLFEDCIKACVKFLEAVPWSEDEERKILNLIPFLSNEESKELLTRISPVKNDSSEEMLHGLIFSAIHNHPNMAFAKAFVAKLLRDFSSRESVRRVLDKVFEKSLKVVKESLEEYSSPNFRGDHNETEAIQRLNLHSAMTNGKHLLWLVERMIELRVADTAVRAWSEQASFTADLQRAFRDDAWRNIAPSLPAVVHRCTSRLASAVATGNILAARQLMVRYQQSSC
ncbi:BTB/POZ domain-containing protein [Abeliophyllum distichum]|uniref:BTB/POZ domain-containing protein n=1 Tax=Abeliophyllum distichum TaxID=126358 RepID=A0ABD1P154_9LAMI